MPRNDQWVGGAVLVAIGAALLLGQVIGGTGQLILLGLGVVLLLLFAVSRNPGTLIGGGIVTGLGAGVLVAANSEGDIAGAAVLLGLGSGFIGVWLVGLVMRIQETAVWPLIPGAILVAIGLAVLAGSEGGRALEVLGPVLLVGLGVVVIVVALRGRGPGPSSGGPGPSSGGPGPSGGGPG
jgi:hypothetical protein